MIRAFLEDLMHDRPRGPLGETAKGALWVVSGLYGLGIFVWEEGYRRRIFKIHTLPRPVISVGNLTVGGTGKTPFVRHLTAQLLARGERVAILSRGYGPLAPGVSDESLELSRTLPGNSVYVGKDRLRQAKEAMAKGDPTVFLLEDGFQHRRLHRDLDICLVDATSPFGNGHLLPRGILRERPSALRRADLLVLTHLEGWPPTSDLLDFFAKSAPDIPVLFARHRAKACRLVGGDSVPLERLKTERPFVFSGIANPSSLDRTLQSLEVRPVRHQRFPDHHFYTRRERERIERRARALGATALLTTQKDLMRFYDVKDPSRQFGMPLLTLEIEMELFRNEQELTHRLDTLLQR